MLVGPGTVRVADADIEMTRQHGAVDIRSEIAQQREIAVRITRGRREHQQYPIADQQRGKPDQLRPLFRIQINDIGKHIGQTDTAEYAPEPHVDQRLYSQPVIIRYPNQHKEKAPADDPQQELLPRRSLLERASHRVGRGYPCNKKEERKDQVIEMKAVPERVIELVIQRSPEGAARIDLGHGV